MIDFVRANLVHVIAALLLVSRVGDVATTYLGTPTLKLEANPIVRRLRWPFALVTLLAAAIPYWNLAVGVALLIPFLLVCASNASKIWLARTMGEQEYDALLVRMARRSSLGRALLGVFAASAFTILAGSVVWIFYPSPVHDWGFWIGIGIMFYGVGIGLHFSLFYRRLFNRAATEPQLGVDKST